MKYLLLLAFAIAAVTGITLQRSELERNRKRDQNEAEQWMVIKALTDQAVFNASNDLRNVICVEHLTELLAHHLSNSVTIEIQYETNLDRAIPAPAPRRLRVAGPTL